MEEKNIIRCFICLELNRESIIEIEEIQKLIKKKNLFYGKLTELENLHLTLKFIGEIEDSKIEEIKNVLRKISFKPFEVSLGELGLFNDRILWIKLQGVEIWQLQKQMDNLLVPLGFEVEARFMSHITLARIKKIVDKPVLKDYILNLKHRPISFIVKDFCLKKSDLKIEGPLYSDLEKYSLS
jgi:2'-5' RNA ligase